MRRCRRFPTLTASFVVLFLLHSQQPVFGQTEPSLPGEQIPPELSSQLRKTVEEIIYAQNEVLVSGDVEGTLKNKVSAHLYKEAMKEVFSKQTFRRSRLKEKGLDYKAFETSVNVGGMFRDGDVITIKVTETTKLKLDVPGGPEYSGLVQDYFLEFALKGKLWKLRKFKEAKAPTVPPARDNPSQEVVSALQKPLRDAPPNYRADYPFQNAAGTGVGPSFVKAAYTHPPRFYDYDAFRAVEYAKTWALSRNAGYPSFGNDCTNFVSQCVQHGGWQMVDNSQGRTDNRNWYYYCRIPLTSKAYASYSWGAAYNFNVFILQSGRITGLQFYEDCFPGDIIFADWDSLNGTHVPDGRVDHVMMVTGKSTDGEIFVSYHSNDRLDKPMTDLRASEPLANFFGDRVKPQY